MKTFKDTAGREWEIAINVTTVKRVKALLEVDLLESFGTELARQLSTDPILLADLLFCLVKPQADALNITDEQFGEGLAGDAIQDATDAFLEELINFSPSPRRGPLKKFRKKMEQLEKVTIRESEKLVTSDKLDRMVLESLKKAETELDDALAKLGNTSTDLPGSSASTPAPLHSGS